jgi:hypothetical protein
MITEERNMTVWMDDGQGGWTRVVALDMTQRQAEAAETILQAMFPDEIFVVSGSRPRSWTPPGQRR